MCSRNQCLFTLCGSLTASAYLWNWQKYRKSPYLGTSWLPGLSVEEPVVVRKTAKPKVLIVGAGLTGCLTSYLVRKQCGDSINLQVFERSPYPSGRFGAGLRYREGEGMWADMGSQVILHIFTLASDFVTKKIILSGVVCPKL